MMPRTRRLKIIFRWFFPPGSERAKWSYALFIAAITALALFSILSWATYFVETCRAAWASHKQLEVIILTKDVFYVCTQREAKRHNIDTQIQPTSSAQTSSVFDFFTRTSKNSYTRSTLKTLPAENGVRRTSWNCYNSKQYKRRANGACVSTRKACLTPSDMLKSGNESRVQISCEGFRLPFGVDCSTPPPKPNIQRTVPQRTSIKCTSAEAALQLSSCPSIHGTSAVYPLAVAWQLLAECHLD
eukprot:191745-Pyramimonas_sp.AAC.1